ncbi:helix-turn-helix domain-containing protein [bacterium]
MQISLGEYLRVEREKQKLDFEEISSKTRIKKDFLQAIEYEDFGFLPPEPYVSGFIRTYAKFLSLNPEEVFEMYRKLSDADTKHADTRINFDNIKREAVKKAHYLVKIIRFLGLSVITVCITIILFLAFTYISIVSEKKPEVLAGVQKEADPVNIPAAADYLSAVVTAQDKCWIKVYADKKAVFEAILQKGNVKKFDKHKSYNFIIGNIYGVDIKINGKLLNIEKQSRGGVNNITVTDENLDSWVE